MSVFECRDPEGDWCHMVEEDIADRRFHELRDEGYSLQQIADGSWRSMPPAHAKHALRITETHDPKGCEDDGTPDHFEGNIGANIAGGRYP